MLDLLCSYFYVMHVLPERLQFEVLHQSLENEDEILLAIAGIKQVLLLSGCYL